MGRKRKYQHEHIIIPPFTPEKIMDHLNKLFYTIPFSTRMDEDDKMNIIHNTTILILKKLNDGIITEDFQKSKGYIFITLKNELLNQWVRKTNKKNSMYQFTEFIEQYDIEDIPNDMTIEKYNTIINRFYQYVPPELKETFQLIINSPGRRFKTFENQKDIRRLIKEITKIKNEHPELIQID